MDCLGLITQLVEPWSVSKRHRFNSCLDRFIHFKTFNYDLLFIVLIIFGAVYFLARGLKYIVETEGFIHYILISAAILLVIALIFMTNTP